MHHICDRYNHINEDVRCTYIHAYIVCASWGLGSSYEDFRSRMVRDSLCFVDIYEPWTKETNKTWG